VFTVLYALTAFRARGLHSERVPGGPLILAPNHASFMDHFFAGAFVRRRIQFMAKSQLFTHAVPTYIFSHGGVFPVRRGHQDEEAF
jgi:1-acyl-sn-glycerol-3-phosphate acyltransferase